MGGEASGKRKHMQIASVPLLYSMWLISKVSALPLSQLLMSKRINPIVSICTYNDSISITSSNHGPKQLTKHATFVFIFTGNKCTIHIWMQRVFQLWDHFFALFVRSFFTNWDFSRIFSIYNYLSCRAEQWSCDRRGRWGGAQRSIGLVNELKKPAGHSARAHSAAKTRLYIIIICIKTVLVRTSILRTVLILNKANWDFSSTRKFLYLLPYIFAFFCFPSEFE